MTKLTDQPIMKCGCRAMSVDSDGNPACVIHGTFEVAETQPNLEGRVARCDGYGRIADRYANSCIYNQCKRGEPCQCEKPSDGELPFFVYRGPGSFDAIARCKHCGYYYIAHVKKEEAKKEFMPPKRKFMACDNFEPHGPYEYDKFYCGCTMGWD